MNLIERIEADLKEAMKARNDVVVSALRLIRSAFKNKQIDVGHPLTEDEALVVLRTLVKQYKDALADFDRAGRTDLAEKQRNEIELLERYLPAALTEAAIMGLIDTVFASLGDGPRDIGRVMGAVMKEVAGRADGNLVRSLVQKRISG